MPRVKSFSSGGILVDSFRSLTGSAPIRPLFLPSLAILPLIQYPGARAEWLVEAGDLVAEDQIIARGQRPIDLPLHAPIPGRVVEFRDLVLPGGMTSSAALIQLEGEFSRTGRSAAKKDWALVSDRELKERIANAGLFLESSPLDPRRSLSNLPAKLETLVINGLQPEPYLTLSIHLQHERREDLAEGIRILQKLYQPVHTHFAADPDHPETWGRSFAGLLDGVDLHTLPFKYPQAQEGLLLRTLGISVPAGAKNRCLILDVSSVLAIRDAVVEGSPQVEKSVILSGRGVRNPGAYRVRIGTPLSQLIKDAGGLRSGEHTVVVGGPLLGQAVDHLSTPVLKSTQAVLVLERSEVNATKERPCIRCGQCVDCCPVGLEPLNLHKALVGQGNPLLAREEGLDFCIECGICSYICPSRIPLVSEFQKAKGVHSDS